VQTAERERCAKIAHEASINSNQRFANRADVALSIEEQIREGGER
jgi:hypothetical protein